MSNTQLFSFRDNEISNVFNLSLKMHENVILVVDYDKICRLCLQSTGAMSNIFDNSAQTSLAKLVLCATGLKVLQGDSLPSNICHKCRYVVELCCEFQEMALKTHSLLIEASSNDHLATEYSSERNENNTAQSMTPSSNTTKADVQHALKGNAILTYERNDLVADINGFKDVNDCNVEETRRKLKVPMHVSTERVRKSAPKHLTCQICLTSFPTVEEVSTHAGTHYIHSHLTNYLKLQRPYECEECKDGIISKTELIKHHRRHLNVNPFICKEPGCSFVGKNPDSLRHHGVRHAAHTQVCERCGARYRRRWELRVHCARQHRRQPRTCRVCRRRFRNELTYQAHLLTHEREPRYPCPVGGCPKAYHSRGALEAHTRAHCGERSYRCRLCDTAAYTSQSLLNRHLRMHERKRTSKCDKCAATFDDYGAFYRHRVSAHGPWQPYRCLGCNQGYQREAQLHKHNLICELAQRMQSYAEETEDVRDDEMVVTSEQEIIETENQTLAMETDEVFNHLKGQSILIQPGNVKDLNNDSFVLHELPPDGLLYIEVDPDSDEEISQVWQQ